MKISGNRIAGFLRHPDPDARAVLIYGSDRGLVRERADAMAAAVSGDLHDPFRNVALPAAIVRGDPARLADEAAALSFTGGRRVVRIPDASDGITEAVAAMLSITAGDALVILEAGPLTPRSSLRKLAESDGHAAAIACHEDEGAALSELIAGALAEHGLNATPEAVDFLAGNLGSDRAVTRSELEKLALYMGGAGTVQVGDAAAVVGDSGAMSIDSTIIAACGGDLRALDRSLERAFAEGVQPVAILRAAARHLLRLHLARAHVDGGRTPDQAMMALKPPVFQGARDRFREHLRRWNGYRLATALDIVTEAEIDCKTTGIPAEAVCCRTLMRIAQAARSAAGGR